MYTEQSSWAKCLFLAYKKSNESIALAFVDQEDVEIKVESGCFPLSFVLCLLLDCQEGKQKMKRWLPGRF